MKKFILILLMSLFVLASCGIGKTALSEDKIVYAGKWVTNDGTWLHIYNDGSGAMKSGGTSVEGGAATFAEDKIKIGLFGIGKTYTIDKEPYMENGKMKMKLDGFIYERAN